MLVLSNFFFCHNVFKKLSAAEASESIFMRQRVNSTRLMDLRQGLSMRLCTIQECINKQMPFHYLIDQKISHNTMDRFLLCTNRVMKPCILFNLKFKVNGYKSDLIWNMKYLLKASELRVHITWCVHRDQLRDYANYWIFLLAWRSMSLIKVKVEGQGHTSRYKV